MSAACGFAQTPATNPQELKAKLQQLEGMMRSLQGEIAAVEQAQKAPGTPMSSAPSSLAEVALPVSPLPLPRSITRYGRTTMRCMAVPAPRPPHESFLLACRHNRSRPSAAGVPAVVVSSRNSLVAWPWELRVSVTGVEAILAGSVPLKSSPRYLVRPDLAGLHRDGSQTALIIPKQPNKCIECIFAVG